MVSGKIKNARIFDFRNVENQVFLRVFVISVEKKVIRKSFGRVEI
jgi:hypothetical protein